MVGLVLVVEEVAEEDGEAEPVEIIPEVFEVSGVRFGGWSNRRILGFLCFYVCIFVGLDSTKETGYII